MTCETAPSRHRFARFGATLTMILLLQAVPGPAVASDLRLAEASAVPGLTVHRGTDVLAEKDQAIRAKAFDGQAQPATGVLRQAAPGVTVVRGHGWKTSAKFEAGVAALKQPRLDVVGLDGGWFIDREAGRLINCFRERTAAVGGYRIRCASRPLP